MYISCKNIENTGKPGITDSGEIEMEDLRKESPLCMDCSGFFCRNNYDSVLKCLSEGHSQYSPKVKPEGKKIYTEGGRKPMKLPKWLVTLCCVLLVACVIVLLISGVTKTEIDNVLNLICTAYVAVGAVVAAILGIIKCRKKLE